MKLKSGILITFLLLLFSSSRISSKAEVQQPYVSFQVFYDELSPYGEWVDYPNYGYVWLPDAGPDFVPYSTNGHWIYTDYGWTWLSNYEWGWAPFHYGRWNFDHYYGWFWVPDSEWGPAWVAWRSADGYYGWEPLEPGISLSMSFGRSYDSHDDHWIFVRDRDIDRSDIHNYYIGRTDQDRIIRRSSMINNTYVDRNRNTTYITGPARNDFQRVTGRRVNPVTVQEYNRPGQNVSNDRVSIYRPEFRKNGDNGQRSEPSRISNLKDVKQPSERSVRSQPAVTKTPATNQDRQPNTVNPQRNSNTSQPQNIRKEQPQNNVRQQTTNPPQNTRKEIQPNNIKQQNTPPLQNIKREQPQNNIKQQNTNPPQNTQRDLQQNNVKQQNATPPQNTRREVQQNNIKQQNNVKQQNSAPQNARKGNQSNTSRSTDNAKKDQKKKTETVDEKIKN
jgi:hypothetical protein